MNNISAINLNLDFMDTENLIFSQNPFSSPKESRKSNHILDQRENTLINSLLILIEIKRENNFLKNKLRTLENLLKFNIFEKRIQKNPIEITLWSMSEKDKKFKEKLNMLTIENNKTYANKKKKKIKQTEILNNEEEGIGNDNMIKQEDNNNNLNKKNSDNILNQNFKEEKINKNLKMGFEDFDLNSNSTTFNLDFINKTGKENENKFNLFSNNFGNITNDKSNRINIKKAKK